MFVVPAGASSMATMTYIDSSYKSSYYSSVWAFLSSNLGTAYDDRRIIIFARSNGGSISGITVDGIAASGVVSISTGAIYAITVPSGTTATIVVETSSPVTSCAIAIYSMTGHSSTTATDTDTASIASTAVSGTINYNSGGAVVGFMWCSSYTSGSNTWTNLTEDLDKVNNLLNWTSASKNTTSSATGETITATHTASETLYLLIASWS